MNPSCAESCTSQVYFINNTNINYLRPPVWVQIGKVLERGRRLSLCARNMASQPQENRGDLDGKARQGETVVPGGTGGKSLQAQEHLAQGRSKGGQTRNEELGSKGYEEMGSKGGQARKEQMAREAYQELGRKGGLSNRRNMSGGEEGYWY